MAERTLERRWFRLDRIPSIRISINRPSVKDILLTASSLLTFGVLLTGDHPTIAVPGNPNFAIGQERFGASFSRPTPIPREEIHLALPIYHPKDPDFLRAVCKDISSYPNVSQADKDDYRGDCRRVGIQL